MNRKIIIGGIAIIILLITGYTLLDNMLFDGIRPRVIQENGFSAHFFANQETSNQPAVIVLGGGPGGDFWGQQLAEAGYPALALPYYRQEGLPALMEEIPLEYFGNAIDWLGTQPEVNEDKVIIMGASRNAELALVIASYLPEKVHGTIAFAPSSVSWSNTVLPFNSDDIKPSWTFRGEAIPFIPMEKITGGESNTIETLPYLTGGLADSNQVTTASIPVEQISGPILLLSGLDDQVWPSAMMSDMIEDRLEERGFQHKLKNLQFEGAGHLISRNLATISQDRTGHMPIGDKLYEFEFGGTIEQDQAAIIHSEEAIMTFLEGL